MGILTFIVVLVVLIVVHELGHFFVAKWSGMRVDEFGIGYPPKLWGKKFGETEYTINALPFGGFVRIYGEDPNETENYTGRAFVSRPRILQALVLLAGVAMNILLAWLLLAIVLGSGAPRALSPADVPQAQDVELAVNYVLPGSPADDAGLRSGDIVLHAEGTEGAFEGTDMEAFTSFISSEEEISLTVRRDGQEYELAVAPETGIVEDEAQPAIGVSLVQIGVLPLAFHEIIIESFTTTVSLLKQITIGITVFLANALTLQADFSQVAGPVGIAGVVSDASENGLIPLMTLTALISLNLAVINLIPVPALDGGRLLFVIIEAITRRPIPPRFATTLNTIGFVALIVLMVAVTVSDIGKLLG